MVGGGDSAVEEAVYLTKYSPEVHLLVRSDKVSKAGHAPTTHDACAGEAALCGSAANTQTESLSMP